MISNVRYGFGYTEDKVVELVIDVMTSALKATTTLFDESTVISVDEIETAEERDVIDIVLMPLLTPEAIFSDIATTFTSVDSKVTY